MTLRNIDPLLWYQHGRLAPSDIFWLAGWGALLRWHRSPRGKDPREWMSTLEQNAPENRPHIERYVELMDLVHYWQVTRMSRATETDRLSAALEAIATTPENKEAYKAASNTLHSHMQETEELEEAMWLRLAKMQSHLFH